MSDDIIFRDCKTGFEFESKTVDFLRMMKFTASHTGRNDGGIDIVATKEVASIEYKFYIQCKYFNTTLGKHPIQEVFAGASYYEENSGKGLPVVITNNRVTKEARLYAKHLGVEIIADAEWKEFKQIIKDKKVTNPNIHKGLFGLIIVQVLESSESPQAKEYMQAVLTDSEPNDNFDDSEDLILKIQNEFDEAEEFIKESARLYQMATQNQQKAMNIHRDAIIRHLKYG